MAEESTVCELEGLEQQLQSLVARYPGHELRSDTEQFCSDFCGLVEEYSSRWQVPLPQLRILEIALCYFSRASTFFTSNCDHMLHTLSSLALSIFELLLFFDLKDFHQEPLREFTVTFQECHSVLAKHQNVHFVQVERLVQGGGPWASPALQAILSESSLPQNEVDGYISSELPVFLELRVQYLLSCQRVREAMALARCCARHPTAGQHSFFLQLYLTWLHKTSQHDCLHKEVADLNGKDPVHIICSLESEQNDELLLGLTTAFLSQQLRRGDMYYLCDLVLVWTKLHSRLNTTKQVLLQKTRQLMQSATNVKSIFPFIRAMLQEVGEAGIQFCVELCANALQSCLPCDDITKTLIYKTIAALLPNDLEVCRACALLVFFLERTVESYKVVYLLYMHPDQEYHVDCSPIGNHMRFETLQIMKKDLCFDPEFWNLTALRTNCLKLLSEKVVSTDLEEIMEDKWISNYCTKDSASRSAFHKGRRRALQWHHQDDAVVPSKRLNVGPGKTCLNVAQSGKRRGHRRSRPLKAASSQPLRRSFWQLDRLQDNADLRRTTRLSEKTQQKRRIRKPRWLLEDSGTLEQKNAPLKITRHGLRHQKHHRSSVMKRSDPGQLDNNVKYRHSVNSELKVKENGIKYRRGLSLDCPKPAPTPQLVLELSLPDNEVMGTFSDDAHSRQRGLPQVLLYKPTVKLLETYQPVKTVHGKEVILRARDAVMFVQQLHCYTRRQRGKGKVVNAHGSVSTITRSSVQGSPAKEARKESTGGGKVSRTANESESPRGPPVRAASQKVSSVRGLSERSTAEERETCEEPAVEMKVTIASQSPVLDKVSKDVAKVEDTQTPIVDKKVSEETPPVSKTVSGANTAAAEKENENVAPTDEAAKDTLKIDATKSLERDSKAACENVKDASFTPTEKNDLDNISTLTLVTEMVREVAPEQLVRDPENDKPRAPQNSASKESNGESTSKTQHKVQASSTCCLSEQEAFIVAEKEKTKRSTEDIGADMQEDSESDETAPETEESKLEFFCTFCSKEFKGSRVVAHAMFHYRKDECMFCRVTFKDDLLAMVHLSNHIEKLKRMKENAGHKGKGLSDTKDTATSKTSAKVKTAHMPSESRRKGRPRKSTVCAKSDVPPDSNLLQSRILRSNKPVDGPSSHGKLSTIKHLQVKPIAPKLNGHTVKKEELKRLRKDPIAKHVNIEQRNARERTGDRETNHKLREKQHTEVDSTATTPQVDEESSGCSTEDKAKNAKTPQVLKINTKQNGDAAEDSTVASQEKLCCPLDGCSWYTGLSKNRVALLHHALEEHYGEIKPLELAFRIGNSRCTVCMRVLWSFEHFQHHVERHRLTPRHPCLHQGCNARFKTGIEMRRHTRKHSPLQAMCCLPGCSKLFICLWALNLHEREHYALKSAQPGKNTNMEIAEGQNNTGVEKKRPNPTSKDAETVRDTRELKEEAAHDLYKKKHAQQQSTEIKEQIKEMTENKDSNVLKNLSNKDTSAQPTAPNPRLRQTLRKVTNAAVLSSSLLKRSRKLRHKLKKKQIDASTQGVKKRGRPRKMSRAVHDENTTVGQNKDAVNDNTTVHKNQESPAQLPPSKTVSVVRNEAKDEEGTSWQIHNEAKNAEMSAEESKLKKSAGRTVKDVQVVSHNDDSSNSFKQSVTTTDLKIKTLSNVTKKKRLLKCLSISEYSKNQKFTNGKVSKKTAKKHPNKEISVSSAVKKPAKSKSADLPVKVKVGESDVVKVKVGKTDVTQNISEAGDFQVPSSLSAIQNCTSEAKSKKPRNKKEGKKSASSNVNQKYKDSKSKEVKNEPEKRPIKTSAPAKCEVQHRDETEGKGAVLVETPLKDKEKGEACVPSEPGLTPTPSGTPGENSQNAAKEAKSDKMKTSKKSHPSKLSKKRKAAEKDDKKTVKKQRKNQSDPSVSKKPVSFKTEVQPLSEVKMEARESSAAGPPSSILSAPSHIDITPTRREANTAKSSFCLDTLKKYSKKPHLRVPPTVYLDERYTAMPKRRKEMFLFSSPPEPVRATSASYRQRCANCFTSFDSAEKLQQHKCSKLFGFDSDDED